MPHHETTRPYAKMTTEQKLAAIFTFEPLRDIDPRLLSPTVPVGRRFAYPPLLQFTIAMTARVFGSQRKALIELREPGVWERCCAWYASLIGEAVTLPTAPPSDREQDNFVIRFLTDVNAARWLSEEMTEIAIGQAIHQGQFPEDATPDFANPDLRNTVFGDGTWQSVYSRVRKIRDEITGKVVGLCGSRAVGGTARVQELRHTGTMDGKKVDGINNIFLGTWTDAGRIILASRATVESEGKIAVEMLDHLATRLGRRLLTVVYDGAIEGWWLQDLMARHHLMVNTKPKARSSKAITSGRYTAPDITQKEAEHLYTNRLPIPLGTTAWREREGVKVKRTTYHRLTKVAKEVATCQHGHELWVDAGVLVDVDYDQERLRLVKRVAARATRAVPRPRADLRAWELPIEWELPCEFANGGKHCFTTVWQPVSGEAERPASGLARALYDLRPLGVSDPRFWNIFGRRNNAEGHNHWYKDTFYHDGRAMRLDTDAQHLDQLAAAAVVNAITWWTFNQQTRLGTQQDLGGVSL